MKQTKIGLPGLLLSPDGVCVASRLTECAHRVESKIISSSRQVKICVNLFNSNKALRAAARLFDSPISINTYIVSVCVFL